MKKDEKIADINKFQKLIDTRIAFVQGVINLAFIILIVYLFTIQVLDFNNYKERGIAIRNSSGITLRGNILDRNGLKLATDVLVYEIYAHPSLYSEKRSVEDIAELLWPYLNIPKDELIENLKSKKINMITLKKDVDKMTADKIRRLGLREISVGTLSKRLYPQGTIASHILGYYSHLSQNSVGIENIASGKLTNVTSTSKVQKTANGQIIFDLNTDLKKVVEQQKGEDVKLTIDTSIQYVCEKELAKTIKETKAERGSVIVMDTKNGEILAYASYPNFDPNSYWKFPQVSMKNWSLTDIYPPGSTFKIITVATAMELGAINEFSKIPDSGRMVIDRFAIENYDYKKNPNPGEISLEYLFEHSSNVGSANIALMLNPQDFYAKLRDFGFGQKTGIDLTAESIGLLPKPKNWYKSRRATMGYGYGASVTAIQMISAVSAIANNGLWITPHVMKYNNEEKALKISSRRVLSEENAKAVTRLLAKGVKNGNTVLNLKNYTVAAKTGTSRKQVSSGKDVYASAIGYFPATSPRVAIYVVIDSPKTGADWGSTIAAPLFKDIAEEVAKLLNIPSDK